MRHCHQAGGRRKAYGRRGFRCAELPRCRSRSSSVRVQLKDRHKGRCFFFIFHGFSETPDGNDGNQPWPCDSVAMCGFLCFPRPSGLSAACRLQAIFTLQKICGGEGVRSEAMAHDGHDGHDGNGRSLLLGFSFSGPKVQLINVRNLVLASCACGFS